MATKNEALVTDSARPIGLDQLEFHLQGQLNGQVRNLKLLRKDGGIILRGVVRTYYAKQMAQHAVMQQTRVPILFNEIVVN